MRTPEFGKSEGRTADPSASLGMTILFGNAKYRFQDELSSRPERTRISCHAALDKAACAPLGLPQFWSSHAESLALTILVGVVRLKSCPDTKQKDSFRIVQPFTHWGTFRLFEWVGVASSDQPHELPMD